MKNVPTSSRDFSPPTKNHSATEYSNTEDSDKEESEDIEKDEVEVMEVEENDMDRQDEGIWFNTKITFVIIKKVCNEH